MLRSVEGKKKRGLLPDMDGMMEAKKRRKDTRESFLKGCTLLREADLLEMFETSKSMSVTEDECVAWLIVKYGWQAVSHVARLHGEVPSTLTHRQRLQSIVDLSSGLLSINQVNRILSVMDLACPSLHRDCEPSIRILAPPVQECVECGNGLTAYHECSGRVYGVAGVKETKKVTLRCQKCKLLYNYSQYGDKHQVKLNCYCIMISTLSSSACVYTFGIQRGFRYYYTPREYVEVTDTVFFEKRLLEFQCSLAYVLHGLAIL